MATGSETFGLGDGRTLVHHARSVCEGRGLPCCLHSPSEHRLRYAPLDWDADKRMAVRICLHGAVHPDPDDVNFKATYMDLLEVERLVLHNCCTERCCGR